MDSAPVPPHERRWRHPSELAADHRALVIAERPSRRLRRTVFFGGGLGICLVMVAIVAVTPRSGSSEDPLGATEVSQLVMTTIMRRSDVLATPIATPVRVASGPGSHDLVVASSRSVSSAVAKSSTTDDAGRPTIMVRLPDGVLLIAGVVVDDRGDGLAILEFAEPAEPTAYPLATRSLGRSAIVTVLGEIPMRIELARVGEVAAAEGTPVVDDEGRVLAICIDPTDNGGNAFVSLLADAADAILNAGGATTVP